MNILVVGNGFDLAHGLPTSYSNCLYFFQLMYQIMEDTDRDYWHSRLWRDRKRMEMDLKCFSDTHITFLKRFFGFSYLSNNDPEISFMYDCIRDNLWLLHFENCQKQNQDSTEHKWIDFEREISLVIQKIDSVLKDASEKSLNTDELKASFFSDQDLKLYPHFAILGIKLHQKINSHKKMPVEAITSVIIEWLYTDLNRLTTALEIYLKMCTESDTPINLTDIQEIGVIDKVISFNYTSIFCKYLPKNFDPSCDICYVHGKLRDNITDTHSPLVLGINEYLEGSDRNREVAWVAFKKYFQRLYKHTDYSYMDWGDLSETQGDSFAMQTQENGSKLFIYGHSLDITDRDILRELILKKNRVTIIFYMNAEDLSQKMKNLLKLIGHKKLTQRMRNKTPSIFFKKQSELEKSESDTDLESVYFESSLFTLKPLFKRIEENPEKDTFVRILKRIFSHIIWIFKSIL